MRLVQDFAVLYVFRPEMLVHVYAPQIKRFDNVKFSINARLDQTPDALEDNVIPLTPRMPISHARSKFSNAQNNRRRLRIRAVRSKCVLDWRWKDLWFDINPKGFERAAQMI